MLGDTARQGGPDRQAEDRAGLQAGIERPIYTEGELRGKKCTNSDPGSKVVKGREQRIFTDRPSIQSHVKSWSSNIHLVRAGSGQT